MISAISVVLALSAAARAEDTQTIDELLNSIPAIEAPGAEQPKPVVPDLPFTPYVDQVRSEVLAAWKPSKGRAKKNPDLETRLVLIIAADGQITELKPMVLSGDAHWDADAIEAINEVGKVSAPAANLVSLAREGVVVIFSAKDWLRGK